MIQLSVNFEYFGLLAMAGNKCVMSVHYGQVCLVYHDCPLAIPTKKNLLGLRNQINPPAYRIGSN